MNMPYKLTISTGKKQLKDIFASNHQNQLHFEITTGVRYLCRKDSSATLSGGYDTCNIRSSDPFNSWWALYLIMVVSIYRKAYDEATVRARPVDHLTSSLNKIEILYIIYIIGYWFKPGSIASV